MNKNMTDETLNFHLSQVSRSFSFCISQLKEPFRLWVGLTYLVCRALDTIEDTPFAEREVQLKHFSRFDNFLKTPPSHEEVSLWVSELPRNDISASELELLSQTSSLLNRLQEQPPAMRQIVFDMVSSMSRGMQHFVSKRINGLLRMKNLNDLNQYCFFVAGVVGESLAKLLALVEPDFKVEDEKVMTAHHFGLFLQKVNIVKDAPSDLKLGRHFLIDDKQLLPSIVENADQAMHFLSLVPIKQREFRLFCGWSLFMGIGTLVKLQSKTTPELQRKLSQEETFEILGSVENHIDDPEQMRGLFAKWMKRLDMQNMQSTKNHSPDEIKTVNDISKMYQGFLSTHHLLQLGL